MSILFFRTKPGKNNSKQTIALIKCDDFAFVVDLIVKSRNSYDSILIDLFVSLVNFFK